MIFLFWVFISPIVGAIIGKSRNNSGMGALLGLLLGPLGWLIVLFDDRREKCPDCQGRVPDGAKKCLHCGSVFEIPAGYKLAETEHLKKISCPRCNKTVAVKLKDAAAGITCPHCGIGFIPPL
jgi:DNA-directed RNA polymerase subunit RPC12/RpoP